jgi:ubiquinol-cytochrome c reductase cytochrome b subunit
MARPGVGTPLWRWLDERLGLGAFHYEVPQHGNTILYTLGGVTLGGILILIVTGIYMTQFYHPHPGTDARDSIVYFITKVRFGEFVRGVHYWTANLVLITAVLHLVRVFISASYKRPREMNWVVGVLMLSILTAAFFTGTVLKWDQEAYEALQHNEAVGKIMGRMGTFFTSDLTASVPLLTRLSFIHTSILPTLLTLLILFHLFLVKRHGISPQPDRQERSKGVDYDLRAKAEPKSFFDLHFRQMVGYGMLLAALAALLAIAIPATIGPQVVPGQEVTKPPWIFWWQYSLENWWGINALLWGSVAIPLGLILVPFVDRTRFRHILNRKWMLLFGVAVVLAWIALTTYVGVTPTVEHLEMAGG